MSDHPGIVYAVENLAWPGWIKIGRAEGPERDAVGVLKRRIYQYNTGDPFRGYIVVAEAFASCCHDAERYAHTLLEIRSRRGAGEWFSCTAKVAGMVLQRACAIARQAPAARMEQFSLALEEARSKLLCDTDSSITEIDKGPGHLRAEIIATSKAAQRLIESLSMTADLDAPRNVEIKEVLTRLGFLSDLV
jgi:hypothetical protein